MMKKDTPQHGLGWDKAHQRYTAPALIDLQVNGVDAVDFNDPVLMEADVLKATRYLLSQGVTSFFPTLITGADDHIISLLQTLRRACDTYPLVRACVAGIHLEGPFISAEDGARGAHDVRYVKAPDWSLLERFQEVAQGTIRLVTLAPEWEGAPELIKKCREHDVLVSMGHSLANTAQISQAAEAGLLLSTHLGNGIPLMLKRHPNMLWDQLADDRLYAMIITDGLHTPDAFIRVVMRVKAEKTILVSDATRFAGMAPGEYDTVIGGKIILDTDKRISLKGSGGLLAGAAKSLLEDVNTLVSHGLASLEEAWTMASDHVTDLFARYLPECVPAGEDRVVVRKQGDLLVVEQVTKNGQVVYAQPA
jgi:N-acetylglucosamine-6-phosphate deacetylase